MTIVLATSPPIEWPTSTMRENIVVGRPEALSRSASSCRSSRSILAENSTGFPLE